MWFFFASKETKWMSLPPTKIFRKKFLIWWTFEDFFIAHKQLFLLKLQKLQNVPKTTLFQAIFFSVPQRLLKTSFLIKKVCWDVRSIPKKCPKKFYDKRKKNREKNPKKEPSPTRALQGEGCFWNHHFMTFFTWHEYDARQKGSSDFCLKKNIFLVVVFWKWGNFLSEKFKNYIFK